MLYQIISRCPPASHKSSNTSDPSEHEEEGKRNDTTSAQMKPNTSVIGLENERSY
jgi:hypothetical protein